MTPSGLLFATIFLIAILAIAAASGEAATKLLDPVPWGYGGSDGEAVLLPTQAEAEGEAKAPGGLSLLARKLLRSQQREKPLNAVYGGDSTGSGKNSGKGSGSSLLVFGVILVFIPIVIIAMAWALTKSTPDSKVAGAMTVAFNRARHGRQGDTRVPGGMVHGGMRSNSPASYGAMEHGEGNRQHRAGDPLYHIQPHQHRQHPGPSSTRSTDDPRIGPLSHPTASDPGTPSRLSTPGRAESCDTEGWDSQRKKKTVSFAPIPKQQRGPAPRTPSPQFGRPSAQSPLAHGLDRRPGFSPGTPTIVIQHQAQSPPVPSTVASVTFGAITTPPQRSSRSPIRVGLAPGGPTLTGTAAAAAAETRANAAAAETRAWM